MNNLTHNAGDPSLVVQKVAAGTSASLFRTVYGPNVFSSPTDAVYNDIADAIAEYEKSSEVSPFSSKYDAWRAGLAMLTASELNGLRLFTGSYTGRPDGAGFPRFSHCVECHSIPSVPSSGPDLFTNTCYQNLGVPRNPDNPFYRETDPISNPVGYNPLGAAYIDYGLGASMYASMGLPPGNIGPGSDGRGDFLGINGSFKAPSLRNADLRPTPAFVKAYMHNGVFKSLGQVVHFYNTRNLTTRNEVIDFTLDNPYAGLRGRPLWDPPEYPNLDTLLNPNGGLGTDPGDGPGGESGAQLGNLGLTDEEEDDIVAFLRTLSDGYFDPASLGTCAITSQPLSQRPALPAAPSSPSPPTPHSQSPTSGATTASRSPARSTPSTPSSSPQCPTLAPTTASFLPPAPASPAARSSSKSAPPTSTATARPTSPTSTPSSAQSQTATPPPTSMATATSTRPTSQSSSPPSTPAADLTPSPAQTPSDTPASQSSSSPPDYS